MNRQGWRKYLIASWAIMETVLFGGLLYGWFTLVFVLKQEGIYANLCDGATQNASQIVYNETETEMGFHDVLIGNISRHNTTYNDRGLNVKTQDIVSKCDAQDDKFALAFTIGSVMFCISSCVLGHINYKYGTRVTRIIAMFLFMSGSLMLAFVSTEIPWLIFPGISFIGMGGLPLLVTNTQISNLFERGGSTFVGLLCGAFDMSSAVQLLVKIAFENGIPRKYSFITIAVLHSVVFVSTFVFLPKQFISKPVKSKDDTSAGLELLEKKTNGETGVMLVSPRPSSPQLPSLKSCIRSRKFILHIVWLSLLQLRFYHFIGTLNIFLTRLLDNNDSVSYFTDICQYVMMAGLLSSFTSGIIYDWQKQVFSDSRSQEKRELMPAVLPLSIACLMGVVMSALVLLPQPDVLYVTFIVMTLCRSYLYSMAAGFLSAIFPSKYFGILYGLVIVAAGLISFIQYGFFKWAELYDGAPMHASIALLCVVGFSFVHPFYQWWTSRRAESRFVVSKTHRDE
ncbi:hypothetical protein ScPMuIL_005104 [Solemya velum]